MATDEPDQPGAPDAPVVVPIEDALELHGCRPRDVLAAGRSMGIFPEGKSHDAARLALVRSGASRLALQAVAFLHPAFHLRQFRSIRDFRFQLRQLFPQAHHGTMLLGVF